MCAQKPHPQDGNCKNMAQENFGIGAFYNMTKNQDNPIKTVGRDRR